MKKYVTSQIILSKMRLVSLALGACLATGAVHAQANNALNFDGVNDYVSLPSSLTTGVTNFTFEAWLNYEENGNWARVMDFGSTTTVNMFLTPNNSDTNAPRFAITTGGNPGEERLTGTTALPAGRHHLAVTLRQNGATVTGTLYINGIIAATNPNMTLTPSDLGSLTQLYLGRSQYPVDPYLKGTLDEVRVYSAALTQAQVQADMNTTNGASAVPASLLAYYDFNQGTPQGNNPTVTTLLDRSGNARNGTLINFALSGSTSNWIGPTAPLPVTLTTFRASSAGTDAQLSWQTASERANAYFVVERSLDGYTFAALGTVAGQGTKLTATIYIFTDTGINRQGILLAYYRLRQVDVDGTSTYSPVRTVNFEAVAPTIGLYPNPATLTTTLNLRALPSGIYQVRLLDATGRAVQQYCWQAGQTYDLAVATLPKGTYLMLVSGPNTDGKTLHFTQRLIK